MLNRVDNNIPNTTTVNNRSSVKRTATEAGLIEQSQKTKYFHSEDNVKVNEQNECFLAAANVLNKAESSVDLYNFITGEKQKIRPYLWLLVFQLKTGAILPHHYSGFIQFLTPYVPRNTTTTTTTLSLNNSDAAHSNSLGAEQLLSKVEFDSCKLSFFNLLIDSMVCPNDILLRLINSQDIILNHCGNFLSVCSFLRSAPNATFEEFNASLDKRKLVMTVVDENDFKFEKNEAGHYNLISRARRNKQNKVIEQNELVVQTSKGRTTACYSRNTQTSHNELPIALSNLEQLDSDSLQTMLDKTDVTSEQFNCYKQIFSKIKINLEEFYTYTVPVLYDKNKEREKVSILDIYTGGGFLSGSVAATYVLSDLYENKIDDSMYKYFRYAMLCAIGSRKTFARVMFKKLFSLAFASNKLDIEVEEKSDIEKVLLEHCPEGAILVELMVAMCLKNAEKIRLEHAVNTYVSPLKNNAEVRSKFQVAAVSWLDSMGVCSSSDSILKVSCEHIFFAKPELLAPGAMPVIEACKNLFIRNFIYNPRVIDFQEQRFEEKKKLFGIAFQEITTTNDFRNRVISEAAGFAESQVRQLFLDYRACPGLFHEMKINGNLVQLITQSFNCSTAIKGAKAFVPGREPEYDETLYNLLQDRIIDISHIALTPQMFILISSTNKNGGLELLTSTAISHFSKNHEAEFKEILIKDIDKLIKLDHNSRLEKRIIDTLKPKFKDIERVLPELTPSPDGNLIRTIMATLEGNLDVVKRKLENMLNPLVKPVSPTMTQERCNRMIKKLSDDFLSFVRSAACVRVWEYAFTSYCDRNNLVPGPKWQSFYKEFFKAAWVKIFKAEIVIPTLTAIIESTTRVTYQTANRVFTRVEHPYSREEMRALSTQILELYCPNSMKELYGEAFKETCKKIISLDESIKETTPELFVQYVLNTICFRTAINLRTILKNLKDSGVASKGLEILRQIDNYLYNILFHDDDDLCSIILLTPPDNEEIYFMEFKKEPYILNLEGGKFMMNYNVMNNSTIITKIFNPDDDMTPQLKGQFVPEVMFQFKLNTNNLLIIPPTAITTEILRKIDLYPHISNYFSKNLSGRSNRSVIGAILAEDFIDFIASMQGTSLEPVDIEQLKKMFSAMTFNLGGLLNISLEVKNKMFRKCNELSFAHKYALLSLNYFTDYAETHKIENKISVIKEHRIKNVRSSIEHIKNKLLPEIIKLIPHLEQSKLVEKISTECNILNKSEMVHLFNFSISLTYLYLSSTYGLGKYQDGNTSFSIFRMLGVYYLSVSLLNIAEKEGINSFAKGKKDLASAIIFEIMDALDSSCSALIANRLYKEESSNSELKNLQDLTKQMLKAQVLIDVASDQTVA